LVWWDPTTWREKHEPKALGLEALPFLAPMASTLAGVSVSGEQALKSPTALSAVRAISETAGNLPLHVYRLKADAERERDRKHVADVLLNVRANPWTGAYEIRTRLIADALLHGRGLAVAIRSSNKVKELHRVPPGTYNVDLDGPEPSYLITQKDGTQKRYGWRDVVDVLTPGSTIERPLCIIVQAREYIALDIAMARYFSKLLGSGARPTSTVTAKDKAIAPEQWQEMRDWLVRQIKDPESGLTFIPAPFEFHAEQFSSVDMEFNAMAGAVRSEVAKAFRVPGVIVGDYSRATWSNSAEMGQQFLQSLLPWLASVEFAFSRVLLTDDDTRFLEHVTFELTKPNVTQLFAAIKTATGTATMTPNEARRIALNLPPIDGGDELVRQAGQSTPADADTNDRRDGDRPPEDGIENGRRT
jgi:HK97 family phage portal protein